LKIIPFVLCGLAFIASLGCQSKVDEGTEFFEVRLHRWTALEGGETFIVRRIGNTWSGSLIGDGQRFSCFYQREAAPKVGDWKQLYEALVQAGILELSGKEPDLGWEDGNGYNLEVTANGKVS